MTTTTGISLPQGVRDILPEEAEKIARVEAAILSVFSKYGFRRVFTPLLEYTDVLRLGIGEELQSKVLKFIDPASGRVMAIRPDITPQIARLAATRMRGEKLPLKLSYNENVLRYGEEGRKPKEVLQAGVEFISKDANPSIDAEVIIMAMEALKKCGIRGFKIDLGDVGFVKGVVKKLRVGEALRAEISDKISKKDGDGLDAAVSRAGRRISPQERNLLLALTTSYGEKSVVKGLRPLVKDKWLRASLDYLEDVVSIISKKGWRDFVTVDMGETRGSDYYTGIIFEGFASGMGKPLLVGGRYDSLMERYGFRAKSTGFAFDLENVVEALTKGK